MVTGVPSVDFFLTDISDFASNNYKLTQWHLCLASVTTAHLFRLLIPPLSIFIFFAN